MAKKTYKSADGTSFHGTTIRATVNQLISAFGEPSDDSNTGEDKVNFEWEMETEDGEVFTIYVHGGVVEIQKRICGGPKRY